MAQLELRYFYVRNSTGEVDKNERGMQLGCVLNERFSDSGRSARHDDGAEGLEHLGGAHGDERPHFPGRVPDQTQNDP